MIVCWRRAMQCTALRAVRLAAAPVRHSSVSGVTGSGGQQTSARLFTAAGGMFLPEQFMRRSEINTTGLNRTNTLDTVMNTTATFYFLYIKTENQRYWWDVGMWNQNMFGADPKAITEETLRLQLDSNGRLQLPADVKSKRPDLQHSLDAALAAGPYNTESILKSKSTDKDGWSYAVDFPGFSSFWGGGSATAGKLDYVRRRFRVTIQTVDSAAAAATKATAAAGSGGSGGGGDTKMSVSGVSGSGSAAAASGGGNTYIYQVINKTVGLVYLGRYELKQKELWALSGSLTEIKFGESFSLQLSSASTKVVVAASKAELKEILSVNELSSMPQVKASWFNSSSFYVKEGKINGSVRVLDQVAYNFEFDPWTSRQQNAKTLLSHNPSYSHWHEAAKVRVFTAAAVPNPQERMCEQERQFRVLRLKSAAVAIQKFCGLDKPLTIEETPVIAFAYSGGGCRATTAAIGWTDGMIDAGLYDCGVYSAGVSGGAWFNSLWMASPNPWKQWVAHYQSNLSGKVYLQSPSAWNQVADTVLRTAAFKPDHSFALPDLYGSILAYEWFKGEFSERDRLDLTCSEQSFSPAFKTASKPLPIYNCVRPRQDLKDTIDKYEWIEFTPYEVAAHDSGLAIPTWAWGREFEHGSSVDFAPEQPFAALMGMFGSAFCASFEEMQRTVGVPQFIMDALRGISSAVAKSRLVGMSRNYNFMSGMESAQSAKQPVIDTVDAGVWVNCPIPAFYGRLERGVDLILAFDARPTEEKDEKLAVNDSKDVLKAFLKYCELHKLRCPAIDFVGVGARYVTVFRDLSAEGSSVPAIAYIPLIKNDAYSTTVKPHTQFNFMDFSYSESDFNALKGLTAFNMKQIIPELKVLITDIVARKKAAMAKAGSGGAGSGSGGGIAINVINPNPAATTAAARMSAAMDTKQ